MRLSEVKKGQTCFCSDGYYHYKPDSPYEERKVVVEGIERANREQGIRYSQVECRKEVNGETFLIDPYYLTLFDEHLTEMQMTKLEQEETRKNAEVILRASGQGAEIEGRAGRRHLSLQFTEEAAERLLSACGAKPIPGNRRPSKYTGPNQLEERERACTLLSRRVARALGGGYVPEWTGRELEKEGGNFQARITLYGDDIPQAAKAAGGHTETNEESSALGALLS